MSDERPWPRATAEANGLPRTVTVLLTTFAESYKQEVAAEEDVHRTLPFFGTALGIVIGSLAYAAGRLPQWPGSLHERGSYAFISAGSLLALAVLEAIFVLVWLSWAIPRQNYKRIGSETDLLRRLSELKDSYQDDRVDPGLLDQRLSDDMREVLLESYRDVTPANRNTNERRYRFRAVASGHLVRSLIWTLAATSVIFISDKFGVFPKVHP